MASETVQPWGRAPTPLVPKPIATELGHLDAPPSVKKVLGGEAKIADLHGKIWTAADAVDGPCLKEIVGILKPKAGALWRLPVFPGRLAPKAIEDLPFSTRTKNVVAANSAVFSWPGLRFGDVLSTPSVGMASAVEFACVAESAVAAGLARRGAASGETRSDDDEERRALSRIHSFFQAASCWGAGEAESALLADVLPDPLPEWPRELKDLWLEMGRLETGTLIERVSSDRAAPRLTARGIADLDEKQSAIAAERVFAVKKPATLAALGRRFGLTRERIRQIEKKTMRKLERFSSDECLPVTRRAESVRDRLGGAVQENHPMIADALDRAVEDFDGEYSDIKGTARSLLLWLAGPYRADEGWLLLDDELPRKSVEELLKRRDARGLIDHRGIDRALSGLGIHQEHHLSWVKRLGKFMHVDDGVICMHGFFPDKALALLRYFDRPMTTDELLTYAGGRNTRGSRNRLIEDPRFWKINVQGEFVPAGTPGYHEFSGIADMIVKEIDSLGGRAPHPHLVEKISRLYGVRKNSVVSYLKTPMFVAKDGFVRVRGSKDAVRVATDISKTPACYLFGRGVWGWRTKIDKDTVRGSGRSVPRAFARRLGCDVGKKIKTPTEFGEVTLSWPMASTAGSSIGSLKRALDHYGARPGDYLFVKATKPRLTFLFLKREKVDGAASDLIRLALLLGGVDCATKAGAVARITEALDIDRASRAAAIAEAARRLSARGETALAALLSGPP